MQIEHTPSDIFGPTYLLGRHHVAEPGGKVSGFYEVLDPSSLACVARVTMDADGAMTLELPGGPMPRAFVEKLFAHVDVVLA